MSEKHGFFRFHWLTDFFHWVGNIFKKGEEIVNDLLPKVIELVNNIKEFDGVLPEAGDLLTKIIPGTWDDDLKNKAREILPQLLLQFKAAQDCLTKATIDEQMQCVIAQLQAMPNVNIKVLQWGDLAALITHDLSDGKLDIEELRSIIKYVYDNNIAK